MDFLLLILNTIILIILVYIINKLDKKCEFFKNENILLKHNVDDCYKYIEHLENEKKEGHYD